MRQQIRSRKPIQAPTIGAFPPNKSAGLSAHSCVTSQIHEAILWATFAPAGHRLNVFLRRRLDGTPSVSINPVPSGGGSGKNFVSPQALPNVSLCTALALNSVGIRRNVALLSTIRG